MERFNLQSIDKLIEIAPAAREDVPAAVAPAACPSATEPVPPAASAVKRANVFYRCIASVQRFRFVRNVAMLSIGTAAAQGFSILAAPVLTRVCPAVAIGQFALFTSFMSVAAVGVSLKYELGIVSAPNSSDAARLTYASAILSVPVSIASGIALYAAIHYSWFGFDGLPTYSAFLMSAVLFLIGIFTALRYWTIRNERFGLISRTIVGQHAARAFSQVCFGILFSGAAGLMTGELLGRAVGILPLFRDAWPSVRKLSSGASIRDLLYTLKGHRKLVVYSLPSTFIDTLVANLPIPIIIKLYGLENGAYFALVQKVLAVPLGLISASVADTFHSSLARCARESPGQMRSLFNRTSFWLVTIGLVPSVILVLFGRSIISVVFGSHWAVAGTLAALSTPWFLSQFVVSPLSRLVFVLHGQELKLIYDVVILTAMLVVTALSMWRHFTLCETVLAFSLSNAVGYVIYYLVLMRIVSKEPSLRDFRA
jgi:lipopolysaccharide exporter